MQSIQNVAMSTGFKDTLETLDTWNQPRSTEALRKFVNSRLISHGDFDSNDLFHVEA